MQDLENIARKYKIKSNAKPSDGDGTSVDDSVRKVFLEDDGNPAQENEYLTVGEEQFAIGYMNMNMTASQAQGTIHTVDLRDLASTAPAPPPDLEGCRALISNIFDLASDSTACKFLEQQLRSVFDVMQRYQSQRATNL
jgi:hypothetical protein